MKKLVFVTLLALASWCVASAQMAPAPEKYNDYLQQVVTLPQDRAEFLMNATMEALSKDPKAYRKMLDLAEQRFSDPGDTLHNEGLYITVLKHATENYVLSASEKERHRLLLAGAMKNQIGQVATDFDYVTPESGDKMLYLKDLHADRVLIYFNNPDCMSCEEVKERIAASDIINKLVGEQRLIVLAVYPYDNRSLWRKTTYPAMMINGFNLSRRIEYDELYDLPSLPCFYLLDAEHRVLMKNEGSLKKVEAALRTLQ